MKVWPVVIKNRSLILRVLGITLLVVGACSRSFGCIAAYGTVGEAFRRAEREGTEPWLAKHMTWSDWRPPAEYVRPLHTPSNTGYKALCYREGVWRDTLINWRLFQVKILMQDGSEKTDWAYGPKDMSSVDTLFNDGLLVVGAVVLLAEWLVKICTGGISGHFGRRDKWTLT